MRLDGFGLFVDDMAKMIRFYKDVLGFEIKEEENTSNVYLVKDGTLFLLYGRNDFEKMTNRRYEYIKGLNGHFEMALYVDTFEEVDGIYDDRLLVKPVPMALRLMPDAEMEQPYHGAKEMILVDDVDNRQFLCELVESMWEELPKKKEKKLRKSASKT